MEGYGPSREDLSTARIDSRYTLLPSSISSLFNPGASCTDGERANVCVGTRDAESSAPWPECVEEEEAEEEEAEEEEEEAPPS
jgi:hypothetical protein